jgi:hypothetical protein
VRQPQGAAPRTPTPKLKRASFDLVDIQQSQHANGYFLCTPALVADVSGLVEALKMI